MSTFDAFSESSDMPPVVQNPRLPVLERVSRRQTIVDISTILVWVVASDLLIYHSGGFSGWAVFLPIASVILLLACRSSVSKTALIVTLGLLVACCVRLAWCGTAWSIACGAFLLLALSMCVNGVKPFVPDMIKYSVHVLVGCGFRMSRYSLQNAHAVVSNPRARYGVLLPFVVVTAFSTIFIFANPDLYRWIYEQTRVVFEHLGKWVDQLDPLQFVFWLVSGWLALGLIYPAADFAIQSFPKTNSNTQTPCDSYVAVRNMMISVVMLFALYLVFEFATLWFREFPEGFYYAGYAHEGAFWLTVALALATLVLSLTFRGALNGDPRVGYLRKWAWIWSLENFLLGLAVVNRLFIYIDFNGMTRMRVIGLLGTIAVLIGFGLVVYKIVRGRGFFWLLRNQLLTVSLAALFYAIAPVDYFVHRFNTQQILAGNPAPCTQIPTHETSAEGLIPLIPLLDCEDRNIRLGIEATLAQWLADYSPALDWRDNQWSHRYLHDQLQLHRSTLQPYLNDPSLRRTVLDNFYTYAYQWY